MRKEEYLEALASSLGGLEAEVREDILLEMGSHLDDLLAREPGRPEEEIVGGLTPAPVLAASLLVELGLGGPQPDRPTGKASREGPPSPGLDELLREGLRGWREAGSRRGGTWEASLPREGLNGVRLDLTRADLSLEPVQGREFQIRASLESRRGKDSEPPLVAIEEGCLVLKEGPGSRVLKLSLGFPQGLSRLAATSSSGSIDCRAGGLDCDFSSGSGDIEVEDGGIVRIKAGSGEIQVRDCLSLVVQAGSGDVDARDVEEALQVKAGSGEVRVKGRPGAVDVTSSSGDLELDLGPSMVKATTSSGAISLRAPEGLAGGALSTSSGSLEVELGECDLDILAETVSGTVRIGRDEAEEGHPRRLVRSLGRGGKALALKSASGDVEVDLAPKARREAR